MIHAESGQRRDVGGNCGSDGRFEREDRNVTDDGETGGPLSV